MRILCVFIISVVTYNISRAESFSFPVIPKTGKTIAEFVPERWFLIDSATGDLNNDSSSDIAVVIQLKDTVDEQRPDSSIIHSNPRILFVIFKNQESYSLVLQNNTFMLRVGEGGMDPDPRDKVAIENGVLDISFQFLRGYTDYNFRMEAGSFCMVAAAKSAAVGNTFDGWDFNFLRGYALHSWGPIGENEKSDKEKRKIVTGQLKKLSEMKKPFMWEVFPYVYI